MNEFKNKISKRIEELKSTRTYTSTHANEFMNLALLDSFEKLLTYNPQIFEDYYLNNKRSGFINKIFKTYIGLLQSNIPFSINKNNKEIVVNSLLANELNIFEGVSEFGYLLNNSNIIENNTKELYTTENKNYGRLFIGKILDVKDKDNVSYVKNIVDYDFNKIVLNRFFKNKEMFVNHLALKPHYQLGILNSITKIAKKIK